MPTKQKTFDTVVHHLRKQGAKSITTTGDCKYRTDTGLKCAVGCLIPDEDYNPNMEGMGISPAFENVITRYFRGWGYDLYLLMDLQSIHDRWPVEEWESGLKSVSNKYRLVYNAP